MNFETRLAVQGREESGLDEFEVRERNRKRILIVGALIVVALLLAAAYAFMNRNAAPAAVQGGAATSDDSKQVPTVTVKIPGRQMVPSVISATGTLAARREMPVGVVGEGGQVLRVLVEPGQWVGAGQVLAVIERSVQSQEINQLAAQINVAEADARLAQSELDRAQSLVSRGFVSKADIDRKTATRDAARARVAVAKAQLGASRARTGRLDIRSPEAGLVLTRAVEPGQVVGAGSGVLFRVARGGEMELRAQLSEADLVRLSNGQSASVTPVGTSIMVNGQIWQLSPVIDPQTRQGIARIALPYHQALRPGGFASAQITAGAVDAPLLPESAVQSDDRGNYVLIINKDNKVERREVKVGSVSDLGVSILTGLAGNEQVVMSAGGFLNPGETVKPDRAK